MNDDPPNDFQDDVAPTAARDLAERHIEGVRQQGGPFVEAVRVTRMPMIVTDATLPGNPITFANPAFTKLSGYSNEELLGQDPHFMNGAGTDPEAVARYEAAIAAERDETLEILQYRKDGTPFRAMLFACPLDDGQGRVTSHFLSYLDVTRRYDAEEDLRALAADLERRVGSRTRELEAANARLTRIVAERDMLLVEVNHRAKNSLAVASALLGLQGMRQKDAAVRALFEESQDRLHSMARLHDLLSRSDSVQRVDAATYVSDLFGTLRAITENDDRIRLLAETEAGIVLDADIAFPLGIVLTELVTNAVKHAFPDRRAGTILARVRRAAPDRAELTIRDDGVGASAPRDGSLGYGLVRTLVKQIKGTMDIGHDGGWTVTITFPVPAREGA